MTEFLKEPAAALGLLTLLILVVGTPILFIVWPIWRRRALRQEATRYKGFVELDERVFAVQEQSGLIRIKARRRSLTWASGFFVFAFGLSLLSLLLDPPTTTTSAASPPIGAIAFFLLALSTLVVSLLLPSITIDPQAQAIIVARRRTTYRITFAEVEKVFTEQLANGKTLFKIRLRNGQDFPLGTVTTRKKAHEQRIQTFSNMLNETIKPLVQTSE